MRKSLLVRNALLLDTVSGDYSETDIRIEDGSVVQTGTALPAPDDVPAVDLAGAHVLPGLIDCHVHVIAATAALADLRRWPQSLVAVHAARAMGQMLQRGFTTVRDTGGGDAGLALAQTDGLLSGPRLLYCGHALSQTGGHGDDRQAGEEVLAPVCSCAALSRIADGVDAVRTAARDELRKGATHLKVMASGGVASPTDRIESLQYSDDELRAAVDEAEAVHRYVAAHAYTPEAIARSLRAGIATIEHGNLLDESSVALLREHDASVVMNLVTYWAMKQEGAQHGLSAGSLDKNEEVLDGGRRALGLATAGGVRVGYGSDLLGDMRRHQSAEFRLRAEIISPLEVIRSATSTAAEIVRLPGLAGAVAPGSYGDLVVTDADPLDDIGALAEPARLQMVVQGGRVVLDRRTA